jgi:HEAT repeat protein
MPPKIGKKTVLLTFITSVLVLIATIVAFRELILEAFYILRLRSPSAAERQLAAQRLGERRSIRAVPKLVDLLIEESAQSNPQSFELNYVGKALLALGTASIPPLLAVAPEKNVVNRAVHDVLVRFGPEAIPSFIEALGWQSEAIREEMAYLLGDMGPAAMPAAPRLLVALEGSSKELRFAVRYALEAILAKPAGEMDASAVAALIGSSKSRDPEVRSLALSVVGTIGAKFTEALSLLMEGIKDPAPVVRASAAASLHAFGSAANAIRPMLGQLLRDEDAEVRAAAVHALTEVGADSAMLPALVHILEAKENQTNVQASAVQVISRLGPEASVALPHLRAAMRIGIGERALRDACTQALGKIGPAAREAVPDLIAALESDVVEAAAESLGEIGPGAEEAVPALIRALNSGWPHVEEVARGALLKIGPAALRGLLYSLKDEDSRIGTSAAIAIGAFDPEGTDAVHSLIEALKGEEPNVRGGAIIGLCEIGPKAIAALPTLLETLKKNDDPGLFICATRAIARMGHAARDAIPLLIEALSNESLDPGEAARALGYIGAESRVAIAGLRRCLEGEKGLLRSLAAISLLRLRQEDPQLREIILDSLMVDNPWDRQHVAEALRGFIPALDLVVPLLTDGLAAGSTKTRCAAARALAEIGLDAKAAVPALKNLSDEPHGNSTTASGDSRAVPAELRKAARDAIDLIEGKTSFGRMTVTECECR